jgi:hypothetical protein
MIAYQPYLQSACRANQAVVALVQMLQVAQAAPNRGQWLGCPSNDVKSMATQWQECSLRLPDQSVSFKNEPQPKQPRCRDCRIL